MTVATEIDRSGPYAGAGTTGPFPVQFRILDATHLQVIKRTSTGETTLVYATDYSVAGVGNPTCSVTLTAVLPVGETLTIIRDVPKTQEADYVQNDDFPAESHENALDKLTMIAQQIGEAVDRALTLPASAATGVSTELPVPEATKLLGWNDTATELQNYDATTLATIVAFGTANADLFSGNGVTTAFNLTANPGALANLDVIVAGVGQRAGIDYTWSGGTVVTFTTAPPLGTNNIQVRYFQGLPQGVADAAATTFIQAGAGAVTRTVQDRLRETISVADFGVVPTATGAVNIANLKKLAAYVKTLGGNVNITAPPGTYAIDGNQLGAYNAAEGGSIDFFGLSNISVEGYGATFTCAEKLGQVWFRFRSCSNVTIAGLKFNGAQTGSGGAASSGVPVYFDTAASNVILRDLSGSYGYSLVEFQTDDLIPMGGVKYKNITLRGIKTYAFYHALELLHVDGLFADDISMQGTGTGNDISFRGMYLLNLSNANINGVRSFGNGNPGTGGYPIFLREYTKGGGATLPDYNCDGVNFSNLEFIGCFCGGLELNVASGQIRNVNISNLTVTADNSNVYGGGLLEIAHDGAAPTGINNVKVSNVQITCGTTANGAAGILYRNSSNVTSENTCFTNHQYVNVQVDGNACAPINTGAGGWVQNLSMVNVRTSTTNLTPYITLNRMRDATFDRFVMPDKIDFSGGRLVRVEFTHSTLGTIVLNPVDMAPVVLNGDSLTAATITVNASGSDSNIGSAASPIATMTEALARVSKLIHGQTAVTINLPVNTTYGAFTLTGVSNQINLRSPLGATVPSVTITNCERVDIRNGLNCAGGAAITNSNVYIESMTFAGATNGINAVNSRITSSSNNFNGTTVGIKALSQSHVWSTGDTGTASTYGYSVGEASVVYKEASSTLTGTTATKQLVSTALVNF